jgi:hypothetical protein
VIAFLAIAGVVVWLLGIAFLAVFLPKEIHRIPLLSIAADLAPALVAAYLAVMCVAWPAIPISIGIEKLAGRKKS